jgi:type II secretory pathway component PulF
MTDTYRCTVCSETGKLTNILREAADEDALIRSFTGTGTMLVSCEKVRAGGVIRRKMRIRKETVLAFTESIAALLKAGLPLQESLQICAGINAHTRTEQLCRSLLKVISEGEPLYTALEQHAPAFSPLYISLVRLGESVGSVEQVFGRLSLYLRNRKETGQKLLQALVYPVTVCVTAVAVCACIVLFVFPRLQAVFEVFAAGNSRLASSLQQVYRTLEAGTVLVLITAVLVCSAVAVYHCSESFAAKTDRFLLGIPVAGTCLKTLYMNDFSFAMELLCSSGVTVVHALEQAGNVVGNRAFRESIANVRTAVLRGEPLSAAFRNEKIFPAYIVAWTGIGETTGSVSGIFRQIHTYFEQETAHIVGNVMAGAEPAFILAAGILLFVLVGQFVLPVFSMMGAL